MRKYEELAANIIKYVGGKENINSLTHCVTRLRFQLKDEQKANDDQIKNLDGVITLMKSAGQYQVVIGNQVPDVYKEVVRQTGLSDIAAEHTEKKKMGIAASFMDFVTGLMTPILAVMTACGMIKGIMSIVQAFGLIAPKSDLYTLLNAVGDSLFYFFPVFLGYTTAKKMKIDPFVGAAIGAGLMYPTLQGVNLNILGIKINVTYSSTVIPVVLTTVAASFLFKWLQSFIPEVIRTFFVPMITLMISIPTGFLLIGPFANLLSNTLANWIMAIYKLSPLIAGIVIGAGWEIMVLFGIHMGLIAVALVQFAAGQPTPVFSLAGSASFAQTATVFAIWLKTKNKKLKEIALPAWISGIFGVTEPAIYGVTLPRIKYFVISCIGAGLGGAYAGLSGLLAYQMGGMGIFSYPMFYGGHMNVVQATLHFSISILIAMAFSFIATITLFKDNKSIKPLQNKNYSSVPTEEKILTPVRGHVVPLSQVDDEAFSLGVLGKGVAIDPAEGKVYAPVTGTVTTLFPTLHAIGLTSDKGVQILIHIGMNTVNLNGKGFTAHVKQGDRVTQGQLLMDFDMVAIKAAGYSLLTPVIVTNSKDLKKIEETKKSQVAKDEELIRAIY